MGSMNRHMLAAALLSGMVVANGHNGQAMNAATAAREVAPDFNDDQWRKGKGRNCNPRRATGAAVAKRAKAKRRNVAKRASKRA
jgi:hypothetical protein